MPHVAAKGRKKTRLNKSNKRDAVIKGAPSLFSLKPCCAIYSRFHFPFSEKDTKGGSTVLNDPPRYTSGTGEKRAFAAAIFKGLWATSFETK